ncbi:uncharacterized protein LOC131668583 [Phymastichus coffea]|uniref:uncharacterized protein LOC131668583 n=1 Tax=Phymastichus coffea TaxID=108790 RepID=UPI00273C4C53|nr:uncharacterized protein LOC131668583 [Phymastichus coffea]
MMNTVLLLFLGFSLVTNLATTRAELSDEAIQELIDETEREIQKYHLTNTNFETDYCEGPSVPNGILRQLCKNLLQLYLGDHVSSVPGFKTVLYNFAAGKLV